MQGYAQDSYALSSYNPCAFSLDPTAKCSWKEKLEFRLTVGRGRLFGLSVRA